MKDINVTATLDKIRNKGIVYHGESHIVNEWTVIDGQVHIITDKRTIKINKSAVKKELSNILNNNGITPSKTHKPKKKQQIIGAAGRYYKTTNYSKFVFHDKNRSVNTTHVNSLIESINNNNLLAAQPILVNEKFEIIDGQHRLTAAMKLSLPIYYIVFEGLTIDDAIDLNINTKNWNYGDYMEYWISQGNENYVMYKKFRNRYRFGYTLAISLLHAGTTATKTGTKRIFENGDMEINYREKAEFIGRLTLLYGRYGDFANDRSFIRAIEMSYSNGFLDPWLLLKKIRMAPDKFNKCSDTDSYLHMMEQVINYHNHGERIRLY